MAQHNKAIDFIIDEVGSQPVASVGSNYSRAVRVEIVMCVFNQWFVRGSKITVLRVLYMASQTRVLWHYLIQMHDLAEFACIVVVLVLT